MKNINDDYITKAKKLSEENRDRVLSRMGGKLPKHLQKEKLTIEEAIAMQNGIGRRTIARVAY